MGNMKGAVAAMLVAFRAVAQRRDGWGGRLTLAAVADEVMFGPDGAAWLLQTRPGLKADALVCGEGPGWMRLAVGEKGVAWYELAAEGPAGHSSRAVPGSSAIARLASALVKLDGLSGLAVARPPGLHGLPASPDDVTSQLTVNTGTVGGGTVVSQMPISARASIDVRIPPGLSVAEVDRLVDDACDPHGVGWTRVRGWEANWTDVSSPIVRSMAEASESVRGVPAEFTIRLPASDASRWRNLGVPAICMGPQPTLSAGVDDYAEQDDVLSCAAIYARGALGFLAGTSPS
jgi:succinyl-diaminopimelate desuccinylase